MDDIDTAQQLADTHAESSLAAHMAKPHTESSDRCIDCDTTIPEARRKANPNANRCTFCQANHEADAA